MTLEIEKGTLSVFAASDYMPPIPPHIALRVHDLSQRMDLELEAVEELLGEDPLIASRFVRIAQYPLFSGTSSVLSLRRTLDVLGAKAVQELLWQTSAGMKVFRNKVFVEPLAEASRHSSYTAHFARLIAEQTALDPDEMFLFGLLHDIGLLALLIEMSERKPDYTLQEMIPILEDRHGEASARIFAIWGFPNSWQHLAREHHVHQTYRERPSPGAVLHLAHHFAEKKGAKSVLEKVFSLQVTEARLESAWENLELGALQRLQIAKGVQGLRLGESK